ncbi:MAG: hypothetical protein FWG73_06045 [Planctomycetaceae bacterium]|nr:hypothetical protein [Planctomycetaceae bacterium]
MIVGTTNMTLDELDVFRFKDRLISILETKGIKTSHDESLSLLFSRCVSSEQSDWFAHTWSPSINNHSVTPVGLTTTATDAHLIPENGYTFDIPYPTNISYKGSQALLTTGNVKLLSFIVSLTGTTTPDARTNADTQVANPLFNIQPCFQKSLNNLQAINNGTEFDSIIYRGIAGTRRAIRCNGVSVASFNLANFNTTTNGLHFQYEHSDIYVEFFGCHLYGIGSCSVSYPDVSNRGLIQLSVWGNNLSAANATGSVLYIKRVL